MTKEGQELQEFEKEVKELTGGGDTASTSTIDPTEAVDDPEDEGC